MSYYERTNCIRNNFCLSISSVDNCLASWTRSFSDDFHITHPISNMEDYRVDSTSKGRQY